MNESEKQFFLDIFKEKMRNCDEIEDPAKRRDCKISILEDAVLKIGENQKPIGWWLEVIAAGTRPLFDEIKNEMATKEDLQGLATKEDLQGLATKEDLQGLATKEEMIRFKEDLIDFFEDYKKDTADKLELLIQKIDNFDDQLLEALKLNDKKEKKG